MRRNDQKGFTLIELLIVVAIIAILAAIAIPNFLEARVRSQVARSVADMRTVSQAISLYSVDNNHYPQLECHPCGCNLGWYCDWGMIFNDANLAWGGISPPRRYVGSLLTSPISYITTVPSDWFNSKLKPPTQSWLCPDGAECSHVWTLQQLDGNKQGFYGWLRSMGPHLPDDFRYQLESAGPDLSWWQGIALDVPGGGANINRFFYNPTNGTISQGQLLFLDSGLVHPKL